MSLYQPSISHHERRAQEWLASGRPDYAEGSMRKEAKWRLKERELSAAIYGIYPKDALGTLMDEQFEAIASRFASDMERALFGY